MTALRHRARRDFSSLYGVYRRARGNVNARRLGLTGVGEGSYVTASAEVHRDSHLDAYVYVGPDCHLSTPVIIGRYSMLAPRVAVVGADHIFASAGTPTIFAGRPPVPTTIIGSDVWLGYGVIVLAGVTIGDGTIVGAGSVVTSDLPAASICVGNPAKVIRARFETEIARGAHQSALDGPTLRGRFADSR